MAWFAGGKAAREGSDMLDAVVGRARPRSRQQALVDRRARGRRPGGLADAEAPTVFAATTDRRQGPGHPVATAAWHAWICCHPLDEPGEEDRMTTAHATSEDGLAWAWHGTALAGARGPGTPAGPG